MVGREDLFCRFLEGVSWLLVIGREIGVLMAILVVLWDCEVFLLFLGIWGKNRGFGV